MHMYAEQARYMALRKSGWSQLAMSGFLSRSRQNVSIWGDADLRLWQATGSRYCHGLEASGSAQSPVPLVSSVFSTGKSDWKDRSA